MDKFPWYDILETQLIYKQWENTMFQQDMETSLGCSCSLGYGPPLQNPVLMSTAQEIEVF